MKKHCYSAVLASVCAGTFCVASAHAQSDANANTEKATVSPSTYDHYSRHDDSPRSRFYVGADAGGVLTSDPKVKEFLGPVSSGAKVSLDPGVRVGFVGGYRLTDF